MPDRLPPGRAGRVWLTKRIAVAERAIDLLGHKQQLLRREQHRLTQLVDRTGAAWQTLAERADLWSVRALVSGGREELRRTSATVDAAEVHIEWVDQAGVQYPGATTIDLQTMPSIMRVPALRHTAAAYRDALEAAVHHAAARAALQRVEEELEATTRRLRSIRDRWLPHLQDELKQLTLRLDETEREEITRLRWAGEQATASRDAQ